jgi:hypothetical protein
MKKRVYIGAIVFAVLLLALGRLIVRPPLTLGVRRVGRLDCLRHFLSQGCGKIVESSASEA